MHAFIATFLRCKLHLMCPSSQTIPIRLLLSIVISYFPNFRPGARRASFGIHDIIKDGKKQWTPHKHRWNPMEKPSRNQWPLSRKSRNTMETLMKTMESLDETYGTTRCKPWKHSMKPIEIDEHHAKTMHKIRKNDEHYGKIDENNGNNIDK